MSDLKACPFCGRIPDIEYCGEHRWFIRCKCGIAQDKLFFQKCDAVRAWNKRKELRVKDTNVPITDTISRQAAIDAVSKACEECRGTFARCEEKLLALPSTEPSYSCSHEKDAQPKMKGRWIKQIDESINAWWYECSVCGDYPLKDAFGHDSLSQFCPWCGTQMTEGEEDALN